MAWLLNRNGNFLLSPTKCTPSYILNPLMENKSFKSNILEKKESKNPDDYDKQNVIAIIYRELRLVTIALLFLIRRHWEKIPRIKEVVLQASHLGR
jgi:hypothetical protein